MPDSRRTTRATSRAGSLPLEVKILHGDLLRHGDLALLRLRHRETRHPIGQRLDDELARDGNQLLPQRRTT